ncbi:MAG TPA: hypothetical protein PKD45_09040 [Flavobacteriales bacterium]|nr:hypothetical protein [Flavobacteriales bacterium]
MTFWRRFKLFGIGSILGMLLAWAFFGKRLENTDWMPNHRVRMRLQSTLVKTTPQAEAMLKDLHLDLADLRASVLDSFEVNFQKSLRSEDSLVYFVYGNVKGQPVHYMAATLRDFRSDSTATLVSILPGKE